MKTFLIAACTLLAGSFAQISTAQPAVYLPATPQVAYSTLDPYGNYWQSAAIRISGASAFPDGYEAYANQFTPLIGGTLSSIELGVGYSAWSGADSQVDVQLAVATGDLPLSGPILASGTLTTSTPFGSGGLTSFVPSTPVQLNVGQAYWLVLTPHSDTTASAWCLPNYDVVGTFGYTSPFSPDPYQWYTATGLGMKAFRVNVVPEPSISALIGLGLTAFFARRRKR